MSAAHSHPSYEIFLTPQMKLNLDGRMFGLLAAQFTHGMFGLI